MDAENRVVLNCGGIRHEVYKVNIPQFITAIISFQQFAENLIILCPGKSG